jgi:hypothetical protein
VTADHFGWRCRVPEADAETYEHAAQQACPSPSVLQPCLCISRGRKGMDDASSSIPCAARANRSGGLLSSISAQHSLRS